jgi:SNW domain-containing protein 1
MGRKGKERTSNALTVQLDAQGEIKYDVLARRGQSKLRDLPVEVLAEHDPSLERPSEDAV